MSPAALARSGRCSWLGQDCQRPLDVAAFVAAAVVAAAVVAVAAAFVVVVAALAVVFEAVSSINAQVGKKRKSIILSKCRHYAKCKSSRY